MGLGALFCRCPPRAHAEGLHERTRSSREASRAVVQIGMKRRSATGGVVLQTTSHAKINMGSTASLDKSDSMLEWLRDVLPSPRSAMQSSREDAPIPCTNLNAEQSHQADCDSDDVLISISDLDIVAEKLEQEQSEQPTMCTDKSVTFEGVLWKRSMRVTYLPRMAVARYTDNGPEIRYAKGETTRASTPVWSPWMTVYRGRITSKERYEFTLTVGEKDSTPQELHLRASTKSEFNQWFGLARNSSQPSGRPSASA